LNLDVRKEAVVAFLKVLSQHLPGGIEKTMKNLSQGFELVSLECE
jgi:hypothetical protein